MSRLSLPHTFAISLAATLLTSLVAQPVAAQSAVLQSERRNEAATIAVESDAISWFIGGYSGIVNLSLRNGFQVAFGSGRYDVPSFLLEGEEHYDAAQWKATATSVQVLRVGYRFRGPMKNGPALAAIVLNQSWKLTSPSLGGDTRFRPVSVGISAGYYIHVGKHFYVYPTAAFTTNSVASGEAAVNGTRYNVAKFGPNGSVHVGWERHW